MPVLRKVLVAIFAALITFAPALGAEITDVTGRKVEIDLLAKRILLGEARQIHVAAALEGEHISDKTFRGFHEKFLPVAYRPAYFALLSDGDE